MQVLIVNLGSSSILELNFLHKASEEIFTEISRDIVDKFLNLPLSFRFLGEIITMEVCKATAVFYLKNPKCSGQ